MNPYAELLFKLIEALFYCNLFEERIVFLRSLLQNVVV